MGRSRKQPIYLVLSAEILGCIGEDRVYVPDSDPDKPLIDDLQCPAADGLLIALRKAFSITYPRNPFVDGQRQAIKKIRRFGIEALREMPEVLDHLGLKPIPVPYKEKDHHKAQIFKYSLVRATDLRIKIQYEGGTGTLLNLVEHLPGDGVVRTLREIVSDTFSEMHDEEQYESVLVGIREKIWAVLPNFNEILHAIEVEPIASPPPPSAADEE